MANSHYTPRAVFDTLNETIEQYKLAYDAENPRQLIKQHLSHCLSASNIPAYATKDYQVALNFLYSYRGSKETFNAYRREIERLLQWSWFVRKNAALKHNRNDFEAFIEFCIKPYKRWIGTKAVARFKSNESNERCPNPFWRPFEASIDKQSVKNGKRPTKDDYICSQKTLKGIFAVLSSFYTYCLQEDIVKTNPVVLIRQKSKFIRKNETAPVIRRLSDLQWRTVIETAEKKAEANSTHARTVFILSCLYGLYLRISELAASDRWSPTMGDFFVDSNGHWWFKTVGKGNKERQIAVSNDVLEALKHYRQEYLSLPALPEKNDTTPLIGHLKNVMRPMTDTRALRRLVQTAFDDAVEVLKQNNPEETNSLQQATVHWLRHTGISDDVKHRPREHVRDDAGHSSSATTDRYINVELSERAKSARNKSLLKEKE